MHPEDLHFAFTISTNLQQSPHLALSARDCFATSRRPKSLSPPAGEPTPIQNHPHGLLPGGAGPSMPDRSAKGSLQDLRDRPTTDCWPSRALASLSEGASQCSGPSMASGSTSGTTASRRPSSVPTRGWSWNCWRRTCFPSGPSWRIAGTLDAMLEEVAGFYEMRALARAGTPEVPGDGDDPDQTMRRPRRAGKGHDPA